MKTYLIEAYSQRLKFEKDSNVIALTPSACYELDKTNIKYSILEDYYGQTEILKDEDNYFTSQLIWFDELDKFLFHIFPTARKMKLKLARRYYLFLKTMVDPIIIRSKTLSGFIEKMKPASIVYVSNEWKEDATDSTLRFRGDESLFSRLIPIICSKYSVPFSRVDTKGGGSIKNYPINPIGKLKGKFRTNQYVKNMWLFYKYSTGAGIISNLFRRKDTLNIFLLKPGYGSEGLIKDSIKCGYRVFLKSGEKILKCSPLYISQHCRIKKNNNYAKFEPEFEGNWRKIKEYLNNQTKILDWVNQNCEVDVSTIILPRLEYFIGIICPRVLSLIDGYVQFYNDNNINFVITPHQAVPDDFAAISATKYSKTTKSVCIQHGNDVFAGKRCYISELWPYDIYFATDEEMAKYYKKRFNLYNDCMPQIIPSFSYRFNKVVNINQKKKLRVKKGKNKTLIYVPTILGWDCTRLSGSRYEDVWYYRWQCALLKLFASRKDFHFIWKGIPAANTIYDPIPNIINDRRYKNIRYATESFVKWIKRADLVLLDFPSTALYEAAVARLPVMSLYHTSFITVRESAAKLFGNSLQPFSNIREGLDKVAEFLNSNPDEFVASIPYSKTSIVDTIKSFKR